MAERAKHLYAFGPFQLDPAQRLLFRDHAVVNLTPKALDTLMLLVEKQGQLVTKDELLERVWAGTFVEEVTLAKNISTLRKVLGETEDGGEYIETHSKRGYRFVAEVKEVQPPTGGADASVRAQVALHSGERKMPPWRAPLLVILGILLIGGAFWWTRIRVVPAPTNGKIMLAVLPFENLGGDPEQEYFSNGLTEEMITQLGRLEPERLGVIARNSATKYKDAHKDARQIGAELGVDYLLEGSVRSEGGRVRVAAQLIQVRDQSHQWAENYDRDLRDILALQSEVASAIAQQIRLHLTPAGHARLQSARVVNPEAYEDYLKGRFFWSKRTVEGHQKAIEYFQKAVSLDPGYAQGYAGLADAYALLGSWPNRVLLRREAMGRARQAAEKALALDDSLADAHTSLAFVKMHYDWDFAGAEKEYQRAIALDPGYATAHHWYAYDLVALDRPEEAIAEARRAEQADPLSVIISRDLGEMLLFAGRNDEAIAQCRKALEMDPNFVMAHWVLGWAYYRKGLQHDFEAEVAKSDLSAYPAFLALSGKRAEARRLLAKKLQAEAKSPSEGMIIAGLYASLGEADHAFGWLERCFEDRNGAFIVMRVDPAWEPIRSDSRFSDLMRRVGVLR